MKFFAMLRPFSMKCRHCNSIDFRTVGARNRIEASLLWILQPCRCELCGHHFYITRWRTSLEGTA